MLQKNPKRNTNAKPLSCLNVCSIWFGKEVTRIGTVQIRSAEDVEEMARLIPMFIMFNINMQIMMPTVVEAMMSHRLLKTGHQSGPKVGRKRPMPCGSGKNTNIATENFPEFYSLTKVKGCLDAGAKKRLLIIKLPQRTASSVAGVRLGVAQAEIRKKNQRD